MRHKTYIGAAPLLLLSLSACSAFYPVDEHEICVAAMQGLNDPTARVTKRCEQDVWNASKTAAHKAAQPYRNLPRTY